MLDIGRQEVSLQAKRRELISQIAEGRAVVATLMERHTAMGRKIEEATQGLRRLEEQLSAMNTVMRVFDDEGLIMTAEPLVAQPMLRAVDASRVEPVPFQPVTRTTSRERDGFRPFSYLRCLSEGHQLVNSRTASGYATCTRCRVRKKMY